MPKAKRNMLFIVWMTFRNNAFYGLMALLLATSSNAKLWELMWEIYGINHSVWTYSSTWLIMIYLSFTLIKHEIERILVRFALDMLEKWHKAIHDEIQADIEADIDAKAESGIKQLLRKTQAKVKGKKASKKPTARKPSKDKA